MTPMIDVVFQLMIFFILVTEIAGAELEVMVLPEAPEALVDKLAPPGRLTLNVTADGAIHCHGTVVATAGLDRLIAVQASVFGRNAKGVSDLPVLVRGDAAAEYGAVREILQSCARAGVWRIEVAAALPAPGAGEGDPNGR